jgi:hypothetical protein
LPSTWSLSSMFHHPCFIRYTLPFDLFFLPYCCLNSIPSFIQPVILLLTASLSSADNRKMICSSLQAWNFCKFFWG